MDNLITFVATPFGLVVVLIVAAVVLAVAASFIPALHPLRDALIARAVDLIGRSPKALAVLPVAGLVACTPNGQLIDIPGVSVTANIEVPCTIGDNGVLMANVVDVAAVAQNDGGSRIAVVCEGTNIRPVVNGS